MIQLDSAGLFLCLWCVTDVRFWRGNAHMPHSQMLQDAATSYNGGRFLSVGSDGPLRRRCDSLGLRLSPAHFYWCFCRAAAALPKCRATPAAAILRSLTTVMITRATLKVRTAAPLIGN